MATRQEVEAFIIDSLEFMTQGSDNADRYRKLFASMDDKAFKSYIADLKGEKVHIYVIQPNAMDGMGVKECLSVDRNLELAEKLGHDFFQYIWTIPEDPDEQEYRTPIKHMVMYLPARRTSQIHDKKVSVPDDSKTTDALTGQVTGPSKGAKVSYPEFQIISASELDNCALELAKYLGGDIKGGVAYNGMIAAYGTADLDRLAHFSSGVESNNTLRTFLTSAHLKSTL